jgi:hypothetical protein
MGICAFASVPVVNHPARFGVSSPMSQMPQAHPELGPPQSVIPVLPVPYTSGPPAADEALQTVYGPLVNAVPGIHFDGIDNRFCSNCIDTPSDANMAVGPNHLLQAVNMAWAVYDKNGNLAPGFPKTLGSIWTNLGGACASNQGAPIVQYDRLADRWFLSQMGSMSAPYSVCLAVSQTNDPTGAYYLYEYQFGNNYPGSPKYGVWPTATNSAFMSVQTMYQNRQSFIGEDACAYNRTAMLSGRPGAAQVCLLIEDRSGFLPSDLDGPTPPPDGSPGYFVNFGTNSLNEFQLFPNFANPSASTLRGPINIPVSPFTLPCGNTSECIPQIGTPQKLDPLASDMMYRLAYTNFGTYESVVTNHSVGPRASPRWYEIRSPLTPTIFQQGTLTDCCTYRWAGSIAQDRVGDMALGYSFSNTGTYPGIAYTGRVPTDAAGTMESEAILMNGGGSQLANRRWGDFTAMRLDPADDCTFWYTNQYLKTNGSFNWSTHIGSFAFPNCSGGGMPDFTISATPPSQSVGRGQTATFTVTVTAQNGFNGLVTLSATGNPKFSTVTFNPKTVTGSGTSTMSVKTFKFLTKITTSTITITGVSGGPDHTTTVSFITIKMPDDNAPDDPSGQ